MASVADYNVANASGAAVRSDLNNIFQAVVTLNSGTSEPSTMYPFMIWVDTTNNVVKMRNGANDGWLTMPFAMNASNSVDINAGTIDGVSLGATNAITSAVISGDLTVDTSTLKVDSSNNRVGIGTTSPAATLHLDASGGAVLRMQRTSSNATNKLELSHDGTDATIVSTNALTLDAGGDIILDADGADISFKDGGTSIASLKNSGGTFIIKSEVSDGDIYFNGNDGGSAITAMAIDMSTGGKVGIGTTSPSQLLHISDTGSAGIYLEADSDNVNEDHVAEFHMSSDGGATYHKLGTNNNNHGYINVSEALIFERQGSEKARLESGGALLVGTTSTTINSSNFGAAIFADGRPKFSKNVTGGSHVMNVYGNAGEFRVYGDGDVQNTNNSYAGISDQSVKENIVDATDKLEDLKQVQIRNYNLIDDDLKQIGVIAQELEPIFPGLIKECNETGIKAVKYSVFVPILIKAIQELEARVAELEAA